MQNKYKTIQNIKSYYWQDYSTKTVERIYSKEGKTRKYYTETDYTLDDVYHLIIDVINSHGYEYQITKEGIFIKIPDVVCTNVYGSTQDITDMMIKITIHYSYSFEITGRRFSFTPEQWYSEYNFSHLSGFSNHFSSFCFGNSVDVYKYFNRETKGFFHEKLDWLLHYMPIYLSQESTLTNPYKQLSHVRFPGSRDSRLYLKHNYLNYLDHIVLKYNKADIVVELKDTINDVLIKDNYAVYINKETKKEYSALDFSYKPAEYKLQDNPFKFRGKTIIVKLNESKTKPEDYEKLPSEEIKKQIINKYESTINSNEFISSCISRTESEVVNQ